jgi:hypothetical protein
MKNSSVPMALGLNIVKIALFNKAINMHFMLPSGQKFQYFNETKRGLYTSQLLSITANYC